MSHPDHPAASRRGRRTSAALLGSLAVVLPLLASCGEGDSSSGEDPRARSTPEDVAAPVRVSGYLTLEGEPTLARCESGEELAVGGPALPDLLELYTALAPGMEPMEGVFVDVLGGLRNGELDALEVRRAAWEGGGCGDEPEELIFEARGTEPFWTLQVLGGRATWRTPEDQQTFEHQGPYRMDRGGWQVDGVSGSGAPLLARFYDEPCRDAMSGAWFHMTAEVELEGREYGGCAYAGGSTEGAAMDDP
ncbi:MAG: hypothetical protein P8188_05740 [Gemmatimonadota bacterium]